MQEILKSGRTELGQNLLSLRPQKWVIRLPTWKEKTAPATTQVRYPVEHLSWSKESHPSPSSIMQHEMTPPTGLQNNLIDAAAVSCVVKHEACSNGRRVSKQTGLGCKNRCGLSESGLSCNRPMHFTYSASYNHRQDRGSPRRLTAGDQLLLKSVTWFLSQWWKLTCS